MYCAWGGGVWTGVYRGSFPSKRSLLFLEGLHLKSILYLCPEEPPEYYTTFMRNNNVTFLHRGLTGNKEPFVEISVGLRLDTSSQTPNNA